MSVRFPVATGKKKPVQVFECPKDPWKAERRGGVATASSSSSDFKAKRSALSSSSSSSGTRAPSNQKPRPGSSSKPTEDAANELTLSQQIKQEFNDTFSSVIKFANSNLEGKEKKQYEAKRVEALGGKAAKNRSMPYHMLTGIRKAAAVREKRQEQKNKEADVVHGKKRKPAQVDKLKKKKKVDFGIQATKGRFRNGVLKVDAM